MKLRWNLCIDWLSCHQQTRGLLFTIIYYYFAKIIVNNSCAIYYYLLLFYYYLLLFQTLEGVHFLKVYPLESLAIIYYYF